MAGDTARVMAIGEIDAYTSTLLDRQLRDVESSSAGAVELELSRTSFLDSSGLRVLLHADQRLRSAGRELVLVAPADAVIQVIELTGVRDHLAIRAD